MVKEAKDMGSVAMGGDRSESAIDFDSSLTGAESRAGRPISTGERNSLFPSTLGAGAGIRNPKTMQDVRGPSDDATGGYDPDTDTFAGIGFWDALVLKPVGRDREIHVYANEVLAAGAGVTVQDLHIDNVESFEEVMREGEEFELTPYKPQVRQLQDDDKPIRTMCGAPGTLNWPENVNKFDDRYETDADAEFVLAIHGDDGPEFLPVEVERLDLEILD